MIQGTFTPDGKFKLTEEYFVDFGTCYFVVKKGFETDGCSVPFGNRYKGDVLSSAVIHDALYKEGALPRSVADRIFLHLMWRNNVSFCKRYLYYWAVRVGGWMFWKK